MIKVRKPNGDSETIPDACFVEITDDEGLLAEVHFQAANNEIRSIKHGDRRYKDYEKLYGVKFIDRMITLNHKT